MNRLEGASGVVSEPHVKRSMVKGRVRVEEWTTVRINGADWMRDVHKRISQRSYNRRVTKMEKRAQRVDRRSGNDSFTLSHLFSIARQTGPK